MLDFTWKVQKSFHSEFTWKISICMKLWNQSAYIYIHKVKNAMLFHELLWRQFIQHYMLKFHWFPNGHVATKSQMPAFRDPPPHNTQKSYRCYSLKKKKKRTKRQSSRITFLTWFIEQSTLTLSKSITKNFMARL